ncbi:MAG: glycine/betaine/sarcosine/D-proline family reductase selenoprotein B [Deltaproteobacteria bacterium]|nr:glycine/betaine/sarcosine/D-proline family reductase selenoprotein B [Deltaproteobacteria bacterium]
MLSVVHIVNQFFAGLGGEEKADVPVGVIEGAAGVARGLQVQFGDLAKVVSTVFFGDNYFHEHPEAARDAILQELRLRRPQIVVAGPAFNAGRYGLACVKICQMISEELGAPCVTAMHPENPAVAAYREYHNLKVFLLPTAQTATGMTEALSAMARFTCRLESGAEIECAQEAGYVSRGVRRLEKTDRTGADRAIDLLLKRLRGEPFMTEVPMEIWDQATPAAALADLSRATIAIVSTSGVVPWGNPDGFKTYRNTYWRKYNIAELKCMEPGRWEAVHGGYNVSFMNQNPHYGVPLDALRSLEVEGVIGRLYPSYYVVPGNQGAPSVMRRIGEEIAADLRSEGVDGVLLVAT